MEWSAKNEFWKTLVKTIIALSFISIVSFLLFKNGVKGGNRYFLITINADIAGMLVAYVLLLALYADMKISGRTVRYLICLVLVTYVALFSDAVAWIVQGNPDFIVLNHLSRIGYFAADIFESYFFWKYTLTYFKVKNKWVNYIDKTATAGLVLFVALILLNIKFGFYYRIDESTGIYTRGAGYWQSFIFSIVLLVVSLGVVIGERKQLRGLQIVAFFLYVTGPLIVLVISILHLGFTLNPVTTILSILTMYCVLNVSQGEDSVVADKELSIAADIQESNLPKTFPYLPERKEFDIYAIMKPAKKIGGDFYDFFMVDDNHLAMVIADVSGKGIPAALFMMNSRTLIKNRLQAGGDLAQIMEDVNNQLCEGNGADLFITVWVCVIDLATGKGQCVNAGHEYPAVKRNSGSYELIIKKHSMALAMFEDTKFTVEEIEFNPGDSIFVYTDGVTESVNSKVQLYGKERLIQTLNKNPDCTPRETIDNVLQSLENYAKDVEQFDDTTMLCMTYYGKRN